MNDTINIPPVITVEEEVKEPQIRERADTITQNYELGDMNNINVRLEGNSIISKGQLQKENKGFTQPANILFKETSQM